MRNSFINIIIKPESYPYIISIIRLQTELSEVTFCNTGLNDLFLIEFAQIMKEYLLPIYTCDFSRNYFADKGFIAFFEALEGSVTINNVDFSTNPNLTKDVALIAHGIIKTCTIKKLNLYQTGAQNQEASKIEEALALKIEERAIPIQSNTKSAAKR